MRVVLLGINGLRGRASDAEVVRIPGAVVARAKREKMGLFGKRETEKVGRTFAERMIRAYSESVFMWELARTKGDEEATQRWAHALKEREKALSHVLQSADIERLREAESAADAAAVSLYSTASEI